MRNNTLLRTGYTLIEIIVVMSIIGILLAVGFVSYQASLSQSRDTTRKADLARVQSALELYKSNNLNNSYPSGDYSGLALIFEPNYMPKLPRDPVMGTSYIYTPSCDVNSLCVSYILAATLESGELYGINQHGEILNEPFPVIPGTGNDLTPTPGSCSGNGQLCSSKRDCCSNYCSAFGRCAAKPSIDTETGADL